MFDKLDDLLIRFEEVLNELGEPDVTVKSGPLSEADEGTERFTANRRHVQRI